MDVYRHTSTKELLDLRKSLTKKGLKFRTREISVGRLTRYNFFLFFSDSTSKNNISEQKIFFVYHRLSVLQVSQKEEKKNDFY